MAIRVGGPESGSEFEIVDPFDGRQAIAGRELRPVSSESLKLDPLRLLRALRLARELGFEIDEGVFRQAREISLAGVAPERIGSELMRVMDCDRSCPLLERLYEMGFLHQILPEARPLLDQPALMRHSFGTYRKLEELLHRESFFSGFAPELAAFRQTGGHSAGLLKLAGLLHDAGKPETEFVNERREVHFYGHDALGARYVEQIARERLRLSRGETRNLKLLVESHMRLHLLATAPELTDRAIRRFFRDLGDQWFGMMMLTFADGFATAGFTLHLEEKFARMIALKRHYDSIVKIERLVNGDDLIELGLRPGPAFKIILAELQELQVEGRITSKAEGVEYLKQNMDGIMARVDKVRVGVGESSGE
jgi:tRNA nucleotidyltransferase/poly(A) polymerase